MRLEGFVSFVVRVCEVLGVWHHCTPAPVPLVPASAATSGWRCGRGLACTLYFLRGANPLGTNCRPPLGIREYRERVYGGGYYDVWLVQGGGDGGRHGAPGGGGLTAMNFVC